MPAVAGCNLVNVTVLLADDECVLREVMTEILTSQGYRVLQAAGYC